MKKFILIALTFSACAPNSDNQSFQNSKPQETIITLRPPSSKANKIEWIEDDFIDLNNLTADKPTLIYFWTTWCTGCKQSEKWYFDDPTIASTLMENFHLVKVNGDFTEIKLNGEVYANSSENTAKHELNLAFGQGWYGYPNILIFDKKLNFYTVFNPQTYLGYPTDEFLPKLDSTLRVKSILKSQTNLEAS